MPPKLLLLATLASGLTDAASADLPNGLLSDGVFRQVRPLPADRLLRGEHGYELLPAQFGGHWSVVLGGTGAAAGPVAAGTVHFTFAGGKAALESGGATIGKLLGRMSGRAVLRGGQVIEM